MNGTCKTCQWWKNGFCDIVDMIQEPSTRFDIDVDVLDDSGLYTQLRTGPDFGCIHHSNGEQNASTTR